MFGTVVHNTLERIHEECSAMVAPEDYDNFVAGLDDDYVLEFFDAEWRKNTCYDFDIYVFGRDKIADFVRRSFSARLGVTVATELLFVYEVETNKYWLPISRESSTSIIDKIIERGNTPVSSKIDRIDRFVDDAGLIHIKIFDYKTNILPFSRDAIENSRQLGIYDLVARVLYPEAASVECIYDMLRHGRFPVTFSDEFRADLRQYLINLWHQIKEQEEPEERINKYCRWCEIRSTCAAYQAVLEADVPPILTENLDTPEGLAGLYEQYEKLADIEKIIKQRRDEIKAMIAPKIEKDNMGEPLQAGGFEYYLQQNRKYEYDKVGVFNVLAGAKSLSLLPSIISISKTAVERGLRAHPELRKTLEEGYLKTNFNAPTLKRRALKGNTSSNTEENDGE